RSILGPRHGRTVQRRGCSESGALARSVVAFPALRAWRSRSRRILPTASTARIAEAQRWLLGLNLRGAAAEHGEDVAAGYDANQLDAASANHGKSADVVVDHMMRG